MRVGIAGYGLAGRSFHAPLLKGCGFEVATVLTGNSTRARQAKEDFPLVKATLRLDSLPNLNNGEVLDVKQLRDQPVVAFSGIANPLEIIIK